MKKRLIALLIGIGIYGYIQKNPSFISLFTEEGMQSDQAITDAAVWTRDLHGWFPAVAPIEFQMEEQQSSLEEIKETFKMLGLP